jgi:hypothetical protein
MRSGSVDRGQVSQTLARAAWRSAVHKAAAAVIGNLTDRELLIAGAIVYWCEGSTATPHRRISRVSFMNSDPSLIQFFLRFLDAALRPADPPPSPQEPSLYRESTVNTLGSFVTECSRHSGVA